MERMIGGREFVRVARPLDFRGLANGDAPTRVVIDKHHVLVFAAGSHAATNASHMPSASLIISGRPERSTTTTGMPARLMFPMAAKSSRSSARSSLSPRISA